ncbi:MAG: nucleotidyltransferase domain-containing protein [Bacteroidota bacterium]
MTLEEIRSRNLIVLECLSGSQAYGLATPESDTDIKGVFVLPKKEFYGLTYVPQVSDENNDTVFYELGRFIELLSVNNPNLLELLNTPENSTLYRHPFMEAVHSDLFLSKLCKNAFGKYALAQIKKARGLKKKIMNPMSPERKSILAFCFVTEGQGTISLSAFLAQKGWRQEDCGLVNLPHMKDMYGLYHEVGSTYAGLVRGPHSNSLALSSIPKGKSQVGVLYFNKDGYSTYCKEHQQYWDWVKNRNEHRYHKTEQDGKNYDAKNMMHTFRLLNMAIEIGQEQQVNVWRKDREFLLQVKSGYFTFDQLLGMAEEKQRELDRVFTDSCLPERPDLDRINSLLVELRERFYAEDAFQ